MMITYNKLIRDKIPQIIEATGKKATIEKLNDEDYRSLLDQKLYEELEEFKQERDVNELADLVEVVYAIVLEKGITIDEFEKIRVEKRNERGGFEQRLKLVSVEK